MNRNHVLITVTLLFCIVLIGVADYCAQKSKRPEEPVPTEEPVVLSAASVNLMEQDYAEMEQIKADIRERLIEHPDPELYAYFTGATLSRAGTEKYGSTFLRVWIPWNTNVWISRMWQKQTDRYRK